MSHAQRDDDEDADDVSPLTQLHTLCATFNGSTAHYRQVEDGQWSTTRNQLPCRHAFPGTGNRGADVFCEDRETAGSLPPSSATWRWRTGARLTTCRCVNSICSVLDLGHASPRLEQDRIADIERIDILQIKVAKPFEQLLELGGKTVARQLASKMEITRDRRDSRNVYQVAYEDYSAEDLSQYALVQVKLVMRMATQPHRKAHNVAVQITAPNGLNDKE